MMDARSFYKAESRLRRLAARADAARGTVMNLRWLHWCGEWADLHERICGLDDCQRHG